LIAPSRERRAAAQKERVGALLHQARKGQVDVGQSKHCGGQLGTHFAFVGREPKASFGIDITLLTAPTPRSLM
jgi:hypothetical protein